MSAPKYTIEYLIEQIEGADEEFMVFRYSDETWEVRAMEHFGYAVGPVREWDIRISAPTLREALEGAFDATRR